MHTHTHIHTHTGKTAVHYGMGSMATTTTIALSEAVIEAHEAQRAEGEQRLVDVQDRMGTVALHECIPSNRQDVVKLLLVTHRASPDVREYDGNFTPRQIANPFLFPRMAALMSRGDTVRTTGKGVARCAGCEQEASAGKVLRACSACHSSKYCSSNCIKRHWPTHKPACKARVAVLEASALQLTHNPRPETTSITSHQTGRVSVMQTGRLKPPAGREEGALFSLKFQTFGGGNAVLYNETRDLVFEVSERDPCFVTLVARARQCGLVTEHLPLAWPPLTHSQLENIKAFFLARVKDGKCTVLLASAEVRDAKW
mmetsp:Transcript_9675/g.24384  ORF Transcript_9675/g.24384 Transcript_9675/m.24384 type:complete len:314 (-) Transcript_9675:203-1144(-)